MQPKPVEPLERLPLTAESLDLRHRARDLYTDLTVALRKELDAAGLRERRHQWARTDGRRGAEILAGEICELVSVGATAADLEALLGWVRAIAEDCLLARTGEAAPDLLSAEMEEADADLAEDHTQLAAVRILAADKHLTTPELTARLRVVRRQYACSAQLVRAYESELRRREMGLYARRIA